MIISNYQMMQTSKFSYIELSIVIPSRFIPSVLVKHYCVAGMVTVSEDSAENKFDICAYIKVFILDTARGLILLSTFFDTMENNQLYSHLIKISYSHSVSSYFKIFLLGYPNYTRNWTCTGQMRFSNQA